MNCLGVGGPSASTGLPGSGGGVLRRGATAGREREGGGWSAAPARGWDTNLFIELNTKLLKYFFSIQKKKLKKKNWIEIIISKHKTETYLT